MRIATIIVIASVLHDVLRLLSSLFLCNASSSLVVAAATTTDEYGDYNGLDLIEWIRSHPEGFIHPSLRIGRERPGDSTSMNGLFVSSSDTNNNAATAIQKGEVIARIPWDRMITPGKKYNKEKYFSCRAIYNLANELDNSNEDDKSSTAMSKYGPYVTYLKSQSRGIMPGEWSPTGQMFLASYILNNGQLPPYENTWRTKFTSQWLGQCLGTAATADDEQKSNNERIAYWLASSRDEDTLMVPIYDMANHSNDRKKLNTISHKPNLAGEAFTFVASRTIHPGEQIYNSYNRCNVCSITQHKMETKTMDEENDEDDCETYSYAKTFDLFVNFGFVELDYPQSWEFDTSHTNHDAEIFDDDDDSSDDDDDDTEIEFCLFKNETTDELTVHWGYDSEPNTRDIYWLKKQLVRLERLYTKKEILKRQFVDDGDEDDDNKDDKMSTWEWESIWRYHDAVTRAITTAVQSVSTSSLSSGATPNNEEL